MAFCWRPRRYFRGLQRARASIVLARLHNVRREGDFGNSRKTTEGLASASVGALFVGSNPRIVCLPVRGRQKAAPWAPSGLDQNTVFAGLMGMTPSRAEYYRGRAEDCCRSAITAESVDRRLHWLEAAARWIRLAREEGVLPPRQTNAAD